MNNKNPDQCGEKNSNWKGGRTDPLLIRFPKGMKQTVFEMANSMNQSMNDFILDAIEQHLFDLQE
jgi:hypothetical protein